MTQLFNITEQMRKKFGDLYRLESSGFEEARNTILNLQA